MKNLTDFQQKCEIALVTALAATGHQLLNRRMEGQSETYITGRISRTTNEIFIYKNEASIAGPRTDVRFKVKDYVSSAKLVDAFLEKVMALLC